MKAGLSAGVAALALLLAGCGGSEESNLSAMAANEAAPLEQIPAPNNGSWTEVVTKTDEGFLMGNPDAPVKLVEYASMTCPHCATFSSEARGPLKERYVSSGQVSFEFRNFVLNAQDAAVSILARCLPPAAFFRTTEQLFERQQEWGAAIDETEARQIEALPQAQQLAAIARAMDMDTFFARRGMPEASFNQCIGDQQAALDLAASNQRASQEHGITGTPTFLLNGERLDVTDWASVEQRLRAAIGG